MASRYSQALQTISDALNMDAQSDVKEAYAKYLEGLQLVGTSLYNEYNSNGFPGNKDSVEEIKKMLNIARHCLERIDNILGVNSTGLLSSSSPQYSADVDAMKLAECNIPSVSFSPPWMFSPRKCHTVEKPTTVLSKVQTTIINPVMNVTSEKQLYTYSEQDSFKPKKLSPMEKLQKDNAFLCKQFKVQLQSVKDPSRKANLRLELQRRLAENLAVARAKQIKYNEEVKLQEKKALEMAAKKLQQSEAVSEEDEEKRKLFASILQYEDAHIWLSGLRKKLNSTPENERVIKHVVQHVIGARDHPLSLWLAHSRFKLEERIKPLIEFSSSILNNLPKDLLENKCATFVTSSKEQVEEHLSGRNIEDDANIDSICKYQQLIMSSLTTVTETVMLMLGLMFEPLKQEQTWDAVHDVVEEYLIQPLWTDLAALSRIVNFKEEQKIAFVMQQFLKSTPQEMSVPIFLWDARRDILEEAISMIRNLPKQTSPREKVQVFVYLTKQVCIEPSEGKPLGADDLVPTLSYLLVQSGLPQIYSECAVLEQILNTRYLLGEEGYCLTSVLMALKYLESLA